MKKKAKSILIIAALAGCIILVGVVLLIDYAENVEIEKCHTDFMNLYSVQIEAEMKIYEDACFENTATDEQYMLVPEKYYTNRESAMGDGPLRVYITKDGTVIACFGDLEHIQEYYDRGFLGPLH